MIIIIICGSSEQQNNDNLQKVLRTMHSNSLKINPRKCIFAVKKVTFSGHVLSQDGLAPDPKKDFNYQQHVITIKPQRIEVISRHAQFLSLFHERFLNYSSTSTLSHKKGCTISMDQITTNIQHATISMMQFRKTLHCTIQMLIRVSLQMLVLKDSVLSYRSAKPKEATIQYHTVQNH